MQKGLKYVSLAGMITVSAIIGNSAYEQQKAVKAVQKAEDTLMSSCFEIALMKSKLDTEQTNKLDHGGVLEKIREAKIDIELEYYYSWRRTVGYTYDGTNHIWFNRKYHNGMTPCEEAANLAHELMHKIGFGHDFYETKRRPYSVPYLVGTIVESCCQE